MHITVAVLFFTLYFYTAEEAPDPTPSIFYNTKLTLTLL